MFVVIQYRRGRCRFRIMSFCFQYRILFGVNCIGDLWLDFGVLYIVQKLQLIRYFDFFYFKLVMFMYSWYYGQGLVKVYRFCIFGFEGLLILV